MKTKIFIPHLLALALTVLVMSFALAPTASAVETTGDLVNTESFFELGEGDGTTNINLRFGDDVGRVLKYDITNSRFVFEDDVLIEGQLDVDGNLILDFDDTGGDVTIQFGTTLAEVINWDNANSRFNISDDLYVSGTLEVTGDVDFNQNNAIELVLDSGTGFPGSPVAGQVYYRSDEGKSYIYDGSTWVETTNVAATGDSTLFFSPLYPHATYYADGSSNIGRLTYYFDNTNTENAYRWRTSRASLQDYDIVIRAQVPQDFNGWDGTTPMQFRYRTNTANTADNKIDIILKDKNGSLVALTGGSNLANTTWTTQNITFGASTFNAGDWFTINITLSSKGIANFAEAGYLILNYDK